MKCTDCKYENIKMVIGIAKLINDMWKELIKEEQEQIREILK